MIVKIESKKSTIVKTDKRSHFGLQLVSNETLGDNLFHTKYILTLCNSD